MSAIEPQIKFRKGANLWSGFPICLTWNLGWMESATVGFRTGPSSRFDACVQPFYDLLGALEFDCKANPRR